MNILLTMSISLTVQFLSSTKITIEASFNDPDFKTFLVEKYLDICIRTEDSNIFDKAYERLINVSNNLKKTNNALFNGFTSRYNKDKLNRSKEIRKVIFDLKNKRNIIEEDIDKKIIRKDNDLNEAKSFNTLATYLSHQFKFDENNSNKPNNSHNVNICSQLFSFNKSEKNQLYSKNEDYKAIVKICKETKANEISDIVKAQIISHLFNITKKINKMIGDIENLVSEIERLKVDKNKIYYDIIDKDNELKKILPNVLCETSYRSHFTLDRNIFNQSPFNKEMKIKLEEKWVIFSSTKSKTITFIVGSITFEDFIQDYEKRPYLSAVQSNYFINLRFAEMNITIGNTPGVLDKGMHMIEDIEQKAIDLHNKGIIFKTEMFSKEGSEIILENVDKYDWLCNLHIRRFDNVSLACSSRNKQKNII